MKPSEWLEMNEWTQGACFRDRKGQSINFNAVKAGKAHSACAIGAIRICSGDEQIGYTWRERLHERINSNFISNWNDHPARTKDEVIETFKSIGL